ERQITGASVDAHEGGTLTALALDLPRVAAVHGGDDGAALADCPTHELVAEVDAVERQRLAGLLQLPRRALVVRVQDNRAGPAHAPRAVADAVDGVQVELLQDRRWQPEIGEAPAGAARLAGEDQAALADGERAFVEPGNAAQAAAAE